MPGGAAILALLAATAIVGPDLLGGMPFAPTPNADDRSRDQQADAMAGSEASRELAAGLLAGLPFGAGALAQPPSSLGAMAALALPEGLPRLPIPDAPPGPEPLRQALTVYAQRYGSGGADLAAAAPLLGLDVEAEAALARLVLAFVEASRLQDEATAALTAEELVLFSGTPEATLEWGSTHPGATLDDLQGHLDALTQAKVDAGKLAQAGDLLTRAIDLLRVPLSKPLLSIPGPSPEAIDEPPLAPPDAWDLIRATVGLGAIQPAPTNAPTSLDAAVRDLAAAYGITPAQVPSIPSLIHPTLDHAVAGIVAAQAAGMRSGDSAPHAAALLQAIEAATPTLRAWSALLAAQPAPVEGPDLNAFLTATLSADPAPLALLATVRGQEIPPAVVAPDLVQVLERAGLATADAAQIAAMLPPQAGAALALILAADLDLTQANDDLLRDLDSASRTAILLTPHLIGLSRQDAWTPTEAALVEAWASAMQDVDAQQIDALRDAQVAAAAAVAAASALLQPPMSTSSNRGSDLPAPIGGMMPEDPTPDVLSDVADGQCRDFDLAGFSSNCQADVFLQNAAFGGIVVTGPGSTTIDSRFGGGNPRIIIDLGGDDVYRVGAGGASNGFGIPGNAGKEDLAIDPVLTQLIPGVFGPNHQSLQTTAGNAMGMRYLAVALDAAGNDVYRSSNDVGQGAATGLGTVGILWDRDGDDQYEQDQGGEGSERLFQGMGGAGGLALLVDESGADRYLAEGMAQGVGLSPVLPVGYSICNGETLNSGGLCMGGTKGGSAVAGTGILADLGPGADRFEAAGGQGHGGGFGTVGILLDEQGATTYRVTPASLDYQGGRGPTAESANQYPPPVTGPGQLRRAGGLAALIDLGGAGDTYNAPRFPADSASSAGMARADGGWFVLRHPSQELRKGDDALWLNTTNGLALGLDSSLDDGDGDKYADLVELLAQSNPTDPNESPQHTVVDANRRLVEDAASAIVEAVTHLDLADSDGDGYPNSVETAIGTDPGDRDSNPSPQVAGDPGFLVTLPLLCPPDDEDACGGAPCDVALDSCVSLLSIGGPGATTHARPTIVELDLEGDDVYTTVVAGDGAWLTPAGSVLAAGSLSIDVEGDDRYDTPDLARTQGFAQAGISPLGNPYSGASLLVDFNGTDVYRAADRSQASSVDAIAILADFLGDDRYEAQGSSQASHTGPRAGVRGAALLDLRGNDTYRFDTQASLAGTLGGPAGPLPNPSVNPTVNGAVTSTGNVALAASIVAILLDADGTDSYESTASSPTGFETQGAIDNAATPGLRDEAVRAAFLDLGDATDSYVGVLPEQGRTDLTLRKNGAPLHANPTPAGTAFFSDGIVGDADDDGVPGAIEALAGSDPQDPDDRPFGAGFVLQVSPPDGVTGFRLPGLVIGGQGPDVYTRREDFILDLGGNDRYLAPGIGGTSVASHGIPGQPASTSLLLDLGGDDEYRPQPYTVQTPYSTQTLTTTEEPILGFNNGPVYTPSPAFGTVNRGSPLPGPVFLFQPSLGGAVLGVAVLGDQGGDNQFVASTSIDLTADARQSNGADGDANVNVRGWGVTMGASLNAGVGVLVSWDATRNAFNASLAVKAQETRSSAIDPLADAFGVAQGASYGAGTGLLASLGSSDDSYLVQVLAQAPGLASDGGRERAYAQGSTSGSIGLLLDDGGTNRFTARAGFAQGSSSSLSRLAFVGTGGNPVLSAIPMGLLWGGPGDDVYEGGLASQGVSSQDRVPSGTTPGDGEVGQPGIGALLDAGGNDRYLLSDPVPSSRVWSSFFCPKPLGAPLAPTPTLVAGAGDPACALAQGAAELGGLGLLADWAGDDRYEARGRTHVQGAGLAAGLGTLLDVTGNDVYVAKASAQGFALTRGGLASGVFVDLEGQDAYTLSAAGQGYAQGGPPLPVSTEPYCQPIGLTACTLDLPASEVTTVLCGSEAPQPCVTPMPVLRSPFNEPALFLDAGGKDAYRYGGQKHSAGALESTPDAQDNNWIWAQGPDGALNASAGNTFRSDLPPNLPRALGIDAEGFDEAVASYDALGVAGGVAQVSLCVVAESGGPCSQPSSSLAGTTTVVAQIAPGAGFEVTRVTLLRDGAAMASLAGTQGDDGDYEFTWDTTPGSPDEVLDGRYSLSATAFLAPTQEETRVGVASPDLVAVGSEPLEVTIDNGPTGSASLTFPQLSTGRRVPGVSPNVTETVADLRIDVGPGLEHAAGHTGTGDPGANVTVTLVPQAGPASVLRDGYAERGVLRIPIDGHCGTGPSPPACPDGHYRLVVRLHDPGGQELTLPAMDLFIDGTPPASQVIMPERANSTRRLGTNGLAVGWAATDGLAGVDEVTILRLGQQGLAIDSQAHAADGTLAVTGNTTLPDIDSNTTVLLESGSRDALGNEEPRHPDDAVAVIVDFGPPAILELAATPAIVRPGVPVTLSARINDPEGAMSKATVSVGGARAIATTNMDASASGKSYSKEFTFADSTLAGGEETPYIFTVEATDLAGNTNLQRSAAMLDSKPPQPSLLRAPTYRDGTQEVPKGRPGAVAQFDVLVTDFRVEPNGMEFDASALGLGTFDCSDQSLGRRWLCAVTIPESQDGAPLQDGDYNLTLTVTDAAGNAATMPLVVEVDSRAPEILDPWVSAVGPDFVEVSWNTTKPTLASVAYGKSSPPQRSFTPTDELRTTHVVRIPGLDPATRYYLQPVATSESNAVNDTAAILSAMTSSAFMVELPQFPANPDWAERRNVTVSVDLLLDPDQKLSLGLKVQDAQRKSSPLPVAARAVGSGVHHFSIDTIALPDGEYRLIVEAARQADVRRIESAIFTIDNTPPVAVAVLPRPGGIAASNRPDLVLAVIDPLRNQLPSPGTVGLVVDGVNATGQASYSGTVLGQARLIVRLPDRLADGEHRVQVRLRDAAGNAGDADWTFQVDTRAPHLGAQAVDYAPGAARGRPGGPANVTLAASDPSGVAGLAIDLRPWGGQLVALFARADGTWSGKFTVPTGVGDGLVDVPVVGTDANGQEGPAGTLLLDIDAIPPTLVPSSIRLASPTSVKVQATTDEDSVLEVLAAGRRAQGAVGRSHAVVLEGLAPGRTYDLNLVARDVAGNMANQTVSMRIPDDDQPPGAPTAVRAAQRDDGVEIVWQPALDNAAIAGYRITILRDGDEQTSDVEPDVLQFLDLHAPPGPVTYRVRALDVAGLEGPDAELAFMVTAPATLSDAAFNQRSGPADEPFTVSVRYSHPGGQPPDVIRLHHGNLTFSLRPVSAGQDCRTGCTYTASVRLPALSTLEASPETYLEAVTGGESTLLPVRAPFVQARGLGFHEGAPNEAPGFSLILLLVALVAALATRRGGRR